MFVQWIVAPALALLVGTVAVVVVRQAWVTDRDVQWLAGAAATPADEAAVYRRYLQRHRRHRLVGGLFGAAVSLVVGLRWYDLVTIGIGEGNPLGDLLICSVTGVALGALSAESFRLTQPRRRGASLAPRAPLPRSELVRTAIAIAGTSTVVGVVLLVDGRGPQALAAAIVGCAVVLVGQLTRRAVTSRARPLLSDRAAHVDERMRAFAGESVAWLQLSTSILTAAWVLAAIDDGDGALVGLTALGGVVAAVVVMQRAKPRPRRGWRPPVAT